MAELDISGIPLRVEKAVDEVILRCERLKAERASLNDKIANLQIDLSNTRQDVEMLTAELEACTHFTPKGDIIDATKVFRNELAALASEVDQCIKQLGRLKNDREKENDQSEGNP